MGSDRWLVLVGALAVTLGPATAAAAGLTGTLVLSNNGPSMDAQGALPTVQLTWAVQCPGAQSPIYFLGGPQLIRIADGKDFAAAALNIQGDSMPTSGVLDEGEPVGTRIQAMWRAGTISCMPGPGAGNVGGGSNDDIVSNSIIVPPYINPQAVWGGPTPATAPVGLPLYLTLSTAPTAFSANPADSENVTVDITGPGFSFSHVYSGVDWNAGAFISDPDWKALVPNGEGQINFSMEFMGVASNVVGVSVVKLAGACQPCSVDADCAGTTMGSLGCDHGVCNWTSSTGCAAAGVCGGYGCTSGDDSCKCPGASGTTTKKGKGCQVAGGESARSDGGARRGAVALVLAAGLAWWLGRRRRCS